MALLVTTPIFRTKNPPPSGFTTSSGSDSLNRRLLRFVGSKIHASFHKNVGKPRFFPFSWRAFGCFYCKWPPFQGRSRKRDLQNFGWSSWVTQGSFAKVEFSRQNTLIFFKFNFFLSGLKFRDFFPHLFIRLEILTDPSNGVVVCPSSP